MRLLYTTTRPEEGHTLSRFLTNEGIENQLDLAKDSDWGSDGYGDAISRIWVIDEDNYDKAKQWADLFQQDPDNASFQKPAAKLKFRPAIDPDTQQPVKQPESNFARLLKEKQEHALPKADQMGPITNAFLLLCIILFTINLFTAPHILETQLPKNVPQIPLAFSPITKETLYDYPYAYDLVDKVVNLYGLDKVLNPETLPPEGKIILAEAVKTPVWQGAYDLIVQWYKSGNIPAIEAPLFEKIREGEVWRMFTPTLMHVDILHILFNMIWLVVLGKMIEQRLSPSRYLLLIFLVGILSNTFQYLMGGASFIGFSGVVCGMLGFIWMRQRIAPWEGYPLQQMTIYFLFYFILAMLGIQLAAFFMEIHGDTSFTPGIGNTAHISGAIIGILLARMSYFAWSGNVISRPKP